MGIQKLPGNLSMRDLFLDVRLTAVGTFSNNKIDLTGRDTFSVGMMRDNIGFGITDINIEITTSLQPIIDITFKDIYGNTVFGIFKNDNKRGTPTDYSVLFDWPPPKFHLTFKGYLGKPVTWIMNLKKTTTQNNPTDGSYEIKATFIPNQWGFFADIPFLYLHAVKKLKEDLNGSPENKTQAQKNKEQDKVQTIFDLINIGKRVEVRGKETSKEYDKLEKQLTVLKSNAINGILSQDFTPNEVIDGKIPGRAALQDFRSVTVSLHQGFSSDEVKRTEQIKNLKSLSGGSAIQIENRKILAQIGNVNQRFINPVIGQDETKIASDPNNAFQTAVSAGQKIIDDNLKAIDTEKKRRFFDSNKDVLGSIEISDIFSRLAGDAAFVLGSILDAGEKGYAANKDLRDNNRKLIGKFFPLTFNENNEEIPAGAGSNQDAGIDNPGAEMDFVRKFINAISKGIADNRRDEAALDTQLGGENKIIQRISNLEILSDNPYVGSDYKRMAENILVRSGIAAFITRSYDPNVPGDYNTTAGIDNDSPDEIRQLGDKELKNITDDVLKGLSDVDLLSLKKFCSFFNRLFSVDGDNIQRLNADKTATDASASDYVDDFSIIDVGLDEVAHLEQVSRILDTNIILNPSSPTDVTNVRAFLVTNPSFSSLFYTENSTSPSVPPNPTLTNSINSITFKATSLFHNNLLFTIPNPKQGNQYQFVFFNNSNDVSLLTNVQNNNSDADFSSDDDKDKTVSAFGGPLGIVKVSNADTSSKDKNPNIDRVVAINDQIAKNLVVDYSKINVNRELVDLPQNNTDILIKSTDELTPKNVGTGKAYAIYTHSWDESEPELVWGLFNGDDRGRNQRIFLKHICTSIENRISQLEDEQNNVLTQVLGKASANEGPLYRQMHHIFHQWQILGKKFDGGDSKAGPNENLSIILDKEFSRTIEVDSTGAITVINADNSKTPLPSGAGKTETISAAFRYDYPAERISPSTGPATNVANSIISIEPLYSPNANTTILTILQQVCTKNNFLFIPIPGNSDYTVITDIFQPSIAPVSPNVGNIFHVLFTPTPESRSKFNDDKTPIAFSLPDNSSLDAFEIEYGSTDNTIIKSIQVSTDDNKPTAESILNLQSLVDKDNTNKAPTANCSMLSVMEGRSYKMNVETLGNAQISPMQFFFVKNSPIFGGLYQIMKATHGITPNNMTTRFEGIKMRFDNINNVATGVKPITFESLQALGTPASIAQPATINAGNAAVTTTASESIHGSDGLNSAFIQRIKDIRISNTADINGVMKNITGQDFPTWFNATMRNQSVFSGKYVNAGNFDIFWNNAIPLLWDKNPDKKINFIEFLALNTIVINETGGSFVAKIPERVNPVTKTTNPGVAYAFDKISGKKKSYNTLTDVQNKTALELFKDPHFKDAHGNLPFGDTASGLRDTTDSRWASDTFPTEIFKNLPKAVDPNAPTFINEADFFKFRGRGYIQVTGRSIYKSLIQFVVNYAGANKKIKVYQSLWAGAPFNKNLDIIATRTTNAQWDDLFSDADLEIAIRSIREHADISGGQPTYQYIPDLNADTGRLLERILNVAKRISGSARDYVELYKNRILVQTDTLDKSGRV